MHEYLRSIGLSTIATKEQERELIRQVIESPDRQDTVALGGEANLTMVAKEFPGHVGLAVVGETNERGELVPEYYFPFISASKISSTAHLSYEKMADRTGFTGMCEDNRLGMALIFDVQNPTDICRMEQSFIWDEQFQGVALSFLMSKATVLLPMKAGKKVRSTPINHFSESIQETDEPEKMAEMAREEIQRFENAMKRVQEEDILSVVDSFFMPHGMASDLYYFMGRILSRMLFVNPVTNERYYRMQVESGSIEFTVSVNEHDLTGVPEPGNRIKGYGLLLGEMKR